MGPKGIPNPSTEPDCKGGKHESRWVMMQGLTIRGPHLPRGPRALSVKVRGSKWLRSHPGSVFVRLAVGGGRNAHPMMCLCHHESLYQRLIR